MDSRYMNMQQFIGQFRQMWGSDHYQNLALDTILYSKDENGNNRYPEPGLYKMCFTVEGIQEQLNNFTYDVGLLWYFEPKTHSITHMAVDKREIS